MTMVVNLRTNTLRTLVGYTGEIYKSRKLMSAEPWYDERELLSIIILCISILPMYQTYKLVNRYMLWRSVGNILCIVKSTNIKLKINEKKEEEAPEENI